MCNTYLATAEKINLYNSSVAVVIILDTVYLCGSNIKALVPIT